MKVFKAAVCLLITTLILPCFFSVKAARAETTVKYAYAEPGGTVYFCSEKNEDSALFIIPQTYCVEILSDDGTWYYVKYAADEGAYRAVYGYCLKNELTETPERLENLYLNYPIKVVYRAEQSVNFLPPLEIELTAAFYGAYELGKTSLSYVYCGEKFGYVPEKVTSYPLNELPKPVVADVPAQKTESSAMIITAIVITLAAVTAVIVLYLSGRKKQDN